MSLGISKSVGKYLSSAVSINVVSFSNTNSNFKAVVNNIEYNSLLDTLNAGASFYSSSNELSSWEVEEDSYPKFLKSVSSININKTINNGQSELLITGINDELIQIWIKENISLFGNNDEYIWVLKQDYSSNTNFLLENRNTEETLSVLLRIKDKIII